MDGGRWRPGVKRRRFRNPLCLAAACLLVALLVVYACANGIWRAVSGAAAPSLLGLVNSYLNFLPAGYGGSKYQGGGSTVAARQALDTLEQVLDQQSGGSAEALQHLQQLRDVVNARRQEAGEAVRAQTAAAAVQRQNGTSATSLSGAASLRGWLSGGRTADDGSGLTGAASGALTELVGWFRGGALAAGNSTSASSGVAAAGSGAPGGGSSVGAAGSRRTATLPKVLPPEVAARCEGAVGGWCGRYLLQAEIPAKAPPRGSLRCAHDCNGVGNCHAEFGYCHCPAGWTGPDCMTRQRRPCTNAVRAAGWEPSEQPANLSAGGWTASRCAGVCDDDIAACYCSGKFGRIPAPAGSPPGTPPIRAGRPAILEACQPMYGEEGEKNGWGHVENSLVLGPEGWCNAEQPIHHCPCRLDGLGGAFCEIVHEAVCVNQCSGHGECSIGFCKCHAGWYGHDCSQRVAGHPDEPGMHETHRPWLKPHAAMPPAAADPAPGATRKRPLIFVHELPADYHSRMLQYRITHQSCVHRLFDWSNGTLHNGGNYILEVALHEYLLQSEHRTYDWEEADYFYVPAYTGCLMHPVIGWADHPWWHGPSWLRVFHGTNLLIEVKRWIERVHPKIWSRRGGRDHIWLLNHDEGACWAPNEIWQGIMLTHWGRTDPDHMSMTAYVPDNYTELYVPNDPQWQEDPADWRDSIRGHPCFDPKKDLVVPTISPPAGLRHSPLLGAPPLKRDKLLYLRGDVGKYRLPWYSRGIRQKLWNLTRKLEWDKKYNVRADGYGEGNEDYSQMLASSKFCAVVPGDGFGKRAEDAVLHGCLPVQIGDNITDKFETILDWDSFTTRIPEADIERVPDILLQYTDAQVEAMQTALGKVWHRFQFGSMPLYGDATQRIVDDNLRSAGHEDAPLSLPHAYRGNLTQDDAFQTIIQWLYHKIDETRGAAMP